jgi:hypothetical protein
MEKCQFSIKVRIKKFFKSKSSKLWNAIYLKILYFSPKKGFKNYFCFHFRIILVCNLDQELVKTPKRQEFLKPKIIVSRSLQLHLTALHDFFKNGHMQCWKHPFPRSRKLSSIDHSKYLDRKKRYYTGFGIDIAILNWSAQEP